MMDILSALNDRQKEAVLHTEGPLLVLAGAGSGKTKTLISRIAWILSEKKARPYNILAVTFTNKAAREMKERVQSFIPEDAGKLWISTFHSFCLRVLYKYADRLGYTSDFEIADQTDQKNIIKKVFKELDVNPDEISEKSAGIKISGAKDKLQDEQAYYEENSSDFRGKKIAEIYAAYQRELKRNNSMDFDDLIMNTVRIFKEFPDLKKEYSDRFHYIMVDEYQDTNTAQFELVRLLSEVHGNICVVGDDDQSIYGFRGAEVKYILEFESFFPGTHTVRLEENYRSTGNILSAANAVISNNSMRKSKTLWTESGDGSLVRFKQLYNGAEEAAFIADDIRSQVEEGKWKYGDFTILMRTNVQSKEFEDAFRVRGINYELVKGLRFWDTKVIKDLSSYLLTVASGANDIRTLRIINLPKRGIGEASVQKIAQFAAEHEMSVLESCERPEMINGLSAKAADGVRRFYLLIGDLRDEMGKVRLAELVDKIIEYTGYETVMKSDAETHEKFLESKEYVEKLKEALSSYEDESESPDLVDFMRQNGIEGNSLDKESAIDGSNEDDSNRVQIMTMHNSKGLEFPNVYVVGMEEGLFPGYSAINSLEKTAIEEERRLCYVAMTRAMSNLTLTSAKSRMRNGEFQNAVASRFLKEIPIGLLDMEADKSESSAKSISIMDDDPVPAARKAILKPIARSKKTSSLSNISLGSQIGGVKPDYEVGDRVRHFKMGEGVVMDISKKPRDYEVTVDFDKSGIKKMMAGFAKLKKI